MSAFLAQASGIAVTNTQTVVTNADGTVVYIHRVSVASPPSQWKFTAAGLVLLLIILSLVILFRRSKSN